MSEKRVEGDLGAFSIFDVAHSLMMGRKSASVTLTRGSDRGFLYFKEGEVVAATDENLASGERAAMSLFSWRSGGFRIDFETSPPEPNIHVSTDYLMLEVARQLDELQRDSGREMRSIEPSGSEEREVGNSMRGRLDDRLRTELNAAFKRVATVAEPGRAAWTPEVFDPLLHELVQRAGSALFLQAGHVPRLRTSLGFEPVGDEPIRGPEIDGFLRQILSEREWTELRERRELGTYRHVDGLGSFRVLVAQERGHWFLSFTPVGRHTPRLTELCDDAELRAGLTSVSEGLIVVAGPVGAGKSRLTASIVQEQLGERDRLAVFFTAARHHQLEDIRGICISRELPPSGMDFHVAVRGVIDQGADVLAIVGALEREAFHLALAAAGGERLVIFTLESHSATHTLHRLFRWAHTDDGDPLLDALSRRLRFLVDLRPAGLGEESGVTGLAIDRQAEEALRTGALEMLKRRRLVRS